MLRRTADRLRARHNFSVSEIDHQELWQRGRLGAVSIGPDAKRLEELAESLIREAENILGPDLISYNIELFDYD